MFQNLQYTRRKRMITIRARRRALLQHILPQWEIVHQIDVKSTSIRCTISHWNGYVWNKNLI